MKRTPMISAACLALLLSTTSFAADRVVAKYNGQDILKSEVVARIKAASGGELPEGKSDLDDYTPEVKQHLIGSVIQEKLLATASENAKIESDSEYKKQLEDFAKQSKIRTYLEKYVKQRATPAMVRDAYNKYVAELKASVRVSHILVKTEAEANQISSELEAKKLTFEDAVKKYSVDQSNKHQGGEIGFIKTGQTVPEFEKVAYDLKDGSVSAPVKTKFGWHIVKRLPSTVPTFDQSKQNLEQNVKIGLMQSHVGELMQNAKVEIFPTAK